MACSGQVYGLNGSVTLATKEDEDTFFSHDLIRIRPSNAIRPGYLFAFLGHPDVGQPLVIRNAYGSSVPHLDPQDVSQTPVARLGLDLENTIADLAEESSVLWAEANEVEQKIGEAANSIIADFTGLSSP